MRPNIEHAVSLVTSYCSNPESVNWIAAKGILRYLKGTKHEKLRYMQNGHKDCHGYVTQIEQPIKIRYGQ